MKPIVRYAIWSALALLLTGILAFLYLKTQAIDPAQRNTVNGLLRDLKQLDADWNVDVLRSKTGLNKNYDPVTQPQHVVLQLEETIAAENTAVIDLNLREAQKQLKEALNAKIDLVDQFKAQNAILRNSVRFIPVATEELKTRSREAAETVPGKRAQMLALREAAGEILIETLKLGNTGDNDSVIRIRQLLGPVA